jgi:hypothetical protein
MNEAQVAYDFIVGQNPLMRDPLAVQSTPFSDHRLKSFVRRVELHLKLRRITSIDPLHDLLVLHSNLFLVLLDITDGDIDLVFSEPKPKGDL